MYNFKIYYHHDMDGICSKVIMEKYIKERFIDIDTECTIDTYYLNYGEKDAEKFAEITGEERLVIVVDYSFTDKTLPIFAEIVKKTEGKRFIWIDHHDSSLNFVAKHIANSNPTDELTEIFRLDPANYLISKAGSGAYLCWAYCRGSEFVTVGVEGCRVPDIYKVTTIVPPAVQYVSDYDTFEHRLNPVTDQFKLGYDAQKDKYEFMFDLFNFLGGWSSDIGNDITRKRHIKMCEEAIETGGIILDYINAENDLVIKSQGYQSILPSVDGEGPINIYVCNRMSNSWVFGELYDKYKYVVVWHFNGKQYRYSIFSNLKKFPDANCEKYAVKFGGGGHKGAAGWRSNQLMFGKDWYSYNNEEWTYGAPTLLKI